MNKEIIKFSNVSIGYGKQPIQAGINFSIFENDFIGIAGPNGAGKTTLLKTIIGTLKPLQGEIKRENQTIGYVPQRDTVQPLLPYTVFDVVMMGRYAFMGIFSSPGKKDIDIVNECLNNVGLSDLRHQNYNSLSGGQRQRTLIARALAVQPKILILDEPTNGMDTPSHYGLLDLISELHDSKKLTVLIVSHLLSDVANITKKLVLIDRNFFISGDIDQILSEENLRQTYAADFLVTRISDEYVITIKHRKN
ncbi:MAG: metal ABC transporter ATP-binding protein [Methanococcaceae archaeon]